MIGPGEGRRSIVPLITLVLGRAGIDLRRARQRHHRRGGGRQALGWAGQRCVRLLRLAATTRRDVIARKRRELPYSNSYLIPCGPWFKSCRKEALPRVASIAIIGRHHGNFW